MSSGKVVFGWVPMPFGGFSVVQMGFFESFFGFCAFDAAAEGRQVFGGYTYVGTGYIPSSRNGVAKTFLDKTDGEWLLMLDWDVGYDPLAVYQLLDAADPVTHPIVSGCYVTYFGEGAVLRPCWMEEKDGQEYCPVDSFEVGRVSPMTVVGMGFTLIHRGVFERIAADSRWKDDPWPFFGHDIIGDDRTGEDLTFCSRARKTGSTVWGHGGVLLQHTKAKTLTPMDMGEGPFGVSTARSVKVQVGNDKRVLNVGGGSKDIPLPVQYAGWDHVLLDIDNKPGVDVVMDATKLKDAPGVAFTVADPSRQDLLLAHRFDAVYCSHNLEHYRAHEVPIVLEGFKKVLKPDGFVHIRVPDLGGVMRKMADDDLDLDDELYVSPAGPILVRDVIYGFGKEIESSGQDFYCHKTGFTEKRLRKALEEAGFEDINITAQNLELEAVAKVGTSSA